MVATLNPYDTRKSVDGLNQIVRTLNQSIVMYLANVNPRPLVEADPGLNLLHQVADDQRSIVDELAKMVLERRGIVNRGNYPIEFTDLHDLSSAFLLQQVLKYQTIDVQHIESALPALGADQDALVAGQRALGAVRGHLDTVADYLEKNK